jgi:hypothetical protein
MYSSKQQQQRQQHRAFCKVSTSSQHVQQKHIWAAAEATSLHFNASERVNIHIHLRSGSGKTKQETRNVQLPV